MKRFNTGDSQVKPPVVMLVYGQGGVGKTTFGSTAPKPILMDCEYGSKYFGLRGIKLDVALIESWKDVEEFFVELRKSEFETVVIDPIGELMEKLKAHMIATRDPKLVQRDGSPTAAGWGWMKDKMRQFIKATRDLGKHMIIVAHEDDKDDDGKLIKYPLIETKLSKELVNLVDVVGYFTTVATPEGEDKRVIYVQPSEKYKAKDRTDQLGGVIEPDFTKIVNACQGNEVYAWSSEKAKEKAAKEEKAEEKVEEKEEKKEKKTKEAQDKLDKALEK